MCSQHSFQHDAKQTVTAAYCFVASQCSDLDEEVTHDTQCNRGTTIALLLLPRACHKTLECTAMQQMPLRCMLRMHYLAVPMPNSSSHCLSLLAFHHLPCHRLTQLHAKLTQISLQDSGDCKQCVQLVLLHYAQNTPCLACSVPSRTLKLSDVASEG